MFEKASTLTAKKSLAILVADDVRDLQDLISSWLEEAGHTVTRASNGHEIVRIVQERSFDLVVTDIVMPEGDGWNAIAEVHRLHPKTRIFAISGGTREIPASACLRVARGAGAIAILQKPFSRLQLLEEIARLMR